MTPHSILPKRLMIALKIEATSPQPHLSITSTIVPSIALGITQVQIDIQ